MNLFGLLSAEDSASTRALISGRYFFCATIIFFSGDPTPVKWFGELIEDLNRFVYIFLYYSRYGSLSLNVTIKLHM